MSDGEGGGGFVFLVGIVYMKIIISEIRKKKRKIRTQDVDVF
jgi:hypothetical protein